MTGYVVADGRRFPITEIRLAGGTMALTCTVRGPVPSYSGTGPVTVFGEDGIGVCQGDCALSWCEVLPHETLTLHISMAMETCYGDAEAPAVSA